MLVFIWIVTLVSVLFSFRKDQRRTTASLRKTLTSLRKLVPGLIAMIALVGLTLAAFPEDQIASFFHHKGFAGFALVSLTGAIVTIPGPIAFPLAGALLKLGAEPALLASFITSLTMVGVASAPLEIAYFGKRFTMVRQLSSFAAAVAIGLLIGALL